MPIIRRFPTGVISGGRVAGSLEIEGDLSVNGDFNPAAGSLDESEITFDPVNGHKHDGILARQMSVSDLSDHNRTNHDALGTGQIVFTSETQTVTNKTLSAPLIEDIDPTPVSDVLLKVLDGVLYLRDSSDAAAARIVTNLIDEVAGTVDGRDVSADGATLDSHVGASSGVHGVSGSVVGTTDTQELSNKTLDSPLIKDVDTTPVGNVLLKVLDEVLYVRNSGDTAPTKIVTSLIDEVAGTVDGRDVSADGATLDSHVAATSGVHGVSGSLVGTTDTQTLTNKTLGSGTSIGASVSVGTDNAYDIGAATARLANIYAVNGIFGDLVFEERTCELCGLPFSPLDEIGLHVKSVEKDGTHTVPVHLECQLRKLGVLGK